MQIPMNGFEKTRMLQGLVLLSMTLVACHDAPRKNPFDPELTPEVKVTRVTLDEKEGSVFLEWTQYAGVQPFAEYRVLRKVRGLEAVDTVAYISVIEQTSFKDTTGFESDKDYLYKVAVVNEGGFIVESQEVSSGSFIISGVRLLEPLEDNAQGRVSLNWELYTGPFFERYVIWRGSFGQEDQRLVVIEDVAQITWVDTTPLPETEYSYWIVLHAGGETRVSQRREAVYQLTPVALLRADFSSETATVELEWSEYSGPRFAAYEVYRQSEGVSEKSVTVLNEVTATAFTDSLLAGNTEYSYRIFVRTTWGDGVGAWSRPREGKFYALEEVKNLPSLNTEEVQSIGLALDDLDQLYAAVTVISTTTARVMQDGVRIQFPATLRYLIYARGMKPHRLSRIHVAVDRGRVYYAVGLDEEEGGGTMVGMVDGDADGKSEIWSQVIETGDAFPVGLYVDNDGDVRMVDEEGMVYGFHPDGEMLPLNPKLNDSLITNQALPVRHLVLGREAGPGGRDQVFLVAPDRDENHIIGRTLEQLGKDYKYIFAGRPFFDEGVGPEDGQTLSPLVLGFDPSRTRLIVLEEQGRLQVLDARPEGMRTDVSRRYITKWGRFGAGEGEFQVSPPTSVAVVADSQGRIYVADGEERVQVFVP